MTDKRREEYIERIREATIDIYGSWTEFVTSGDIEIDPTIIPKNKNDLVNYVKELTEKIGYVPKQREFSSIFGGSVTKAVIDEFGTWHSFLKVVGLDVDKEILIQHIQSLINDDPEYTPSRADFKKAFGDRELSAIKEEFGSWDELLRQAGITSKRENIRRIELEKIRSLANEIGHIPNISEIRNMLGTKAYNRMNHLFGGYENTVVKAYIDISADDAKDVFCELTTKLGYVPTEEQFRNELCAIDEGCLTLCEAGMWSDIGRFLWGRPYWSSNDGWRPMFERYCWTPEFEVVRKAFREAIKEQFLNTGSVPVLGEMKVSGWPACYFLDQALRFEGKNLGEYDYAWASMLFEMGMAPETVKEFLFYPEYEVASIYRNYEQYRFDDMPRNEQIYRYVLAFGVDIEKYLQELEWPI